MTILFPNPVLCRFSADYENSKAYSAKVEIVDYSEINVTHVLEPDNVVEQLVAKKAGVFFATLVIKKAMFRKTYLCEGEQVKLDQKPITFLQKIWLPELDRDSEIDCHTGVCLKNKKQEIKWDKSSGIVNITGNPDFVFNFPEYCLLATSGWWKIYPRNDGLFELFPNKDIAEGEFEVTLSFAGNFKININLHPDLADHIVRNKRSKERAHVICTAFAQALQELQDYRTANPGEEASEERKAIHLLERIMKNKRWPIWDAADFNPSLVASKLKKVVIPKESDNKEK